MSTLSPDSWKSAGPYPAGEPDAKTDPSRRTSTNDMQRARFGVTGAHTARDCRPAAMRAGVKMPVRVVASAAPAALETVEMATSALKAAASARFTGFSRFLVFAVSDDGI